MPLTFATLDVFTDTRFAGNPLAVVKGADDLDGAQMQAIAAEFNLSETVFVLKPDRREHSAKIRIFTPQFELPFAGHPIVGTAVSLARDRNLSGDQSLIVLEAKIGIVRVGVRDLHGPAPFAEFDLPKLPEHLGSTPPTDVLADALGLLPSEIGFQNHKPRRYSAGNVFTFVPVASRSVLKRAAPNPLGWQAAFGNDTAVGAFVYCREPEHRTSHYRARMFAPGAGVSEDPATGSSVAAFAGVVVEFDTPTVGWHTRTVEQGFEMGRPSLITLSLELAGGRLETARIGGRAVPVMSGQLDV